MGIKVPYVALVRYTVSDSLAGVDDTASPHCEQEVNAFFSAQVDALMHERKPGVGHHATQLNIGDTCLGELVTDLGQKSTAFGALATIMNQHLSAAVFLNELCDFVFRGTSEDYFCRSIVSEIFHTLLVWIVILFV